MSAYQAGLGRCLPTALITGETRRQDLTSVSGTEISTINKETVVLHNKRRFPGRQHEFALILRRSAVMLKVSPLYSYVQYIGERTMWFKTEHSKREVAFICVDIRLQC
eukprot:3802276-Amphidinium_carterae.1